MPVSMQVLLLIALAVLAQRRAMLLHMLRVTDSVLRELGIGYWITDGTLLGAVRNADVIPGDDDADLAMTRSDYARLFAQRDQVRARLAEHGLRLFLHAAHARAPSSEQHATWLPAEISPVDALLVVDIYVWDERDDWLHNEHPSVLARFRLPRSWVFPTRLITLADLQLPAPKLAEHYLLDAYGPTWRVPRSR